MKNYWTRGKDKYGRAVHHFNPNDVVTAGVVIRMPLAYVETYPDRRYLANDWRLTDRDAAVTYHETLQQAKAALEATL